MNEPAFKYGHRLHPAQAEYLVRTGQVGHQHQWVDVTELSEPMRRQMCVVPGCQEEQRVDW